LYATLFQKKKIESNNDETSEFGIASTVSVVILLIFWIYNTYYEIKQMIYHKLSYLSSFWNIIDIISLVLNYGVWIWEFTEANNRNLNLLTSWAVLVMYLKLFYFGRIFFSTASLVSMIIEIAKDMTYFLMIFMIGIAGFGNWYLILNRNIEDGIIEFGDTYFNAFIYAFRQSLGDFVTDNYSGTDKYILFTVWFLNVVIALIVLLNLLIAIMGDTFDRVRENSENSMLKELVTIMSENEMLINRDQYFCKYKYIIVAETVRGEGSELHWDGRLQRLREYLEKNVNTQINILKSMQKNIIDKIGIRAEKLADGMEESTQKRIIGISTKADDINLILNKINARLEIKDKTEDED